MKLFMIFLQFPRQVIRLIFWDVYKTVAFQYGLIPYTLQLQCPLNILALAALSENVHFLKASIFLFFLEYTLGQFP